ncbi:MAG: penicillin-binding protein 1C [Microgenomates group bacterium]
MNSRLNYFFYLIFKGVYFLFNFFVFIGENFRKIIQLILFIFLKGIVFLIKKIFSIKLPKIKLFKKTYTPIKIKKVAKIGFFDKLRYFIYGGLFSLLMVFFYQSYIFVKSLPLPKNIGKVNYPLSTHIYDRNGKLLYEIYRDQNRTPITLKELPLYVIQATIAIEDKDFYRHNGVNLIGGILRAIKENFLNKGAIQGGSTITQQLVKTALLSPERTFERKIKEIILALWTERLYTKDQILEMYLNQVPYGGSAYGIEEAAKTYFGKHAKDLSLSEAALLAGLPQAPSIYSPYNDPEAAIRRRNEVLEVMAKEGYISKELKIETQKSKIEVLPPKNSIYAPHFVFYVKNQLESLYGTRMVEEGGLRVTTTLDLNIQKEAEKILQEEIEKIKYLNVSNGAILVTRPSTGEILAMVGSVDYFLEPWGAFNVTTALRQPGSSIKPIMYSLALQKGFTAASIIDDSPTIFQTPGSSPYRPVNYDGKFHGKVPLRYALANSYNIPAVKVLEKIGVSNFIDFAQKLGISTWQDKSRYGLSLALGGGEVMMIDMAKAFGVLANQGYLSDLNYYLKVENYQGETLKEINPYKIRVIDPAITYIISDILSDNQARLWAFGPNSALEIPGYKVAVKTGTTDNKKDNWTIGYTPDFLVAVWVGNNDGSPMNPYLTSGITGAAPIWNRVMSFLLKNYTSGNRWYEKPENVVEKYCFFGRKEYFIRGTENTVNCQTSLLQTLTPTSTP